MLFKISRNEFVFNINTPSVLTDQLPALEAATTNKMVRINLNALHAARKSFIEVESSEKIQRALRSNVRTYADKGFVTGDTVYYWRQNCKGWRGLTKVLGKEGQCVLISHGGAFYWRYLYPLMTANKELGSLRNEGNKELESPKNEGSKTAKKR